jgi:hypothetical protein
VLLQATAAVKEAVVMGVSGRGVFGAGRTAVAPVAFTVMVVVAAGGGVAGAVNGASLLIGKSNSATAQTSLTNTSTGHTLVLVAKGGVPLALSAPSGTPALSVNTTKQVANLNASYVGGLSSSALQRRVTGTCAGAISTILASGNVLCQQVPTSGSFYGNPGDSAPMGSVGPFQLSVSCTNAAGFNFVAVAVGALNQSYNFLMSGVDDSGTPTPFAERFQVPAGAGTDSPQAGASDSNPAAFHQLGGQILYSAPGFLFGGTTAELDFQLYVAGGPPPRNPTCEAFWSLIP